MLPQVVASQIAENFLDQNLLDHISVTMKKYGECAEDLMFVPLDKTGVVIAVREKSRAFIFNSVEDFMRARQEYEQTFERTFDAVVHPPVRL